MNLRIFVVVLTSLALAACGDDTTNTKSNNGANSANSVNSTNNRVDMGDANDAGSNNTTNNATNNTNNATRVCGNGIVEDGEVCDANQLEGESCETQGFAGGDLNCASNCQAFDTTACDAAPTCGNGAIDADEVCDGTDVGGNTCELLGRGPGTLRCAANCGSFDLSSCGPADTCDGVAIDANEVCDGSNLGNATCESLGFGPETLNCAMDCQGYDTADCSPAPRCGDGLLNGVEVCDGALLDGQTCESQGFGVGVLACASDCRTFDTTGCPPAPTCGDGLINGLEVCDSANLNAETCESQGFGPGTLGCSLDCTSFVTTGCDPAPTCGDGIVNGAEVCDGAALNGESCTTQVAGIGALGCLADCTGYNLVNCCQPDCTMRVCGPDPVCGTTCGNCQAGEMCAAGVCECIPETCASLGAVCGNMPDGCGGTISCGGCTNGEACVNGACGCGTAVDGGTYVIDVPVVDIIFNVTLNGQPLTTANTNDNDEGRIILQDPDTGERFNLPETAGGAVINYPTSRRIIPGYYDVYYTNGGTDVFWPINNERRLIAAADLTSPQTLTVDIQTVDITFEVTLNGQPVTTANTNDNDEGRFILVDPVTAERITLPETAGGAVVNYPTTRRLLPGNYSIHYTNGGTVTYWPINNDHVLYSAVDLNNSQTFTINVSTVDVTFDATLNGQPVTTANTNDNDEGVFRLVDPTTGETINLPETAGGAVVNYPTTRRLIPSNYDIYYGNGGTDVFWPINTNHLLESGVALTSTMTHVIDVPSTDITFEATLNGQPVTPANTNDNDEGRFILEDVTTGERMNLPETAGGAVVNYPTVRRLIPAVYDVYYTNGGTDVFWPINTDHILIKNATLMTAQTFVIDVPTIDATIDVTLDGQPVTTANTNDNDEGRLILEDPSTGERINLPETAGGAVVNYPTTRRLIPAVYDVYYTNGGTDVFWPINTNHVLQSNLNFNATQTYVVDVPVVDVTFDVTLNGAPLTTANTNDNDEGRLILEDPTTGERINLPETAGGAVVNYPTTRRLIGADYDVYYTNGGTDVFWPSNMDKKLSCFGF